MSPADEHSFKSGYSKLNQTIQETSHPLDNNVKLKKSGNL